MSPVRRCVAVVIAVLVVGATAGDDAATPPGRPEGFGAVSAGGTGGRRLVVTSLADHGPGTLRAALESQGPRQIEFAVEGTIALERRIRVVSGQVTVDGGTAPGDGITILNHGLWFVGDCDDIILRDLRIRVLYGAEQGDALLFWGHEGGTVERVLVDHCSLLWATDEIVNTWGNCRDVTVQWTILAEAQMPHSKGWLSGSGSDRITIHHCLFAQNADRNPKLQGGLYDFVNNVVYNWGVNNGAKIDSGARVNLIGNVFRPGPQTKSSDGCVFPAGAAQGTRVWLSDNLSPLTPTSEVDPWQNVTAFEQVGGRWVKIQPAPALYRAPEPYQTAPIAASPSSDVLDLVLANAGARRRDADDLRILREVRDGTGQTGMGPR